MRILTLTGALWLMHGQCLLLYSYFLWVLPEGANRINSGFKVVATSLLKKGFYSC